MTFDMQRRSLLSTIPAAAAGAAFLGGSSASAAPASGNSSAAAHSAVTYLPVSAQKQFQANKVAVKGKAYESFFNPVLDVPTDAARSIQFGQLSKSDCLTPSVSDLNRLLDPAYKTPDVGYAVLDGSTTYVQSRVFFPGATAEMFRWWFTWHPIEKERYMLWFPHAHMENSVKDSARLANASLSYEDRLYENPNFIKELIGPAPMELLIHFTDPIKLGLDAAAYKRAGFTASASGIISPAAAPDAIISMMIHLGRDVDGGMELVSRYWIGAHPELRRFAGAEMAPAVMSKMGFNDVLAEATSYELAVHDMIEYNHLATILPALFAQFGKQ